MLRDVDDVVSSQGVHLREFVRAERGAVKDDTMSLALDGNANPPQESHDRLSGGENRVQRAGR